MPMIVKAVDSGFEVWRVNDQGRYVDRYPGTVQDPHMAALVNAVRAAKEHVIYGSR